MLFGLHCRSLGERCCRLSPEPPVIEIRSKSVPHRFEIGISPERLQCRPLSGELKTTPPRKPAKLRLKPPLLPPPPSEKQLESVFSCVFCIRKTWALMCVLFCRCLPFPTSCPPGPTDQGGVCGTAAKDTVLYVGGFDESGWASTGLVEHA